MAELADIFNGIVGWVISADYGTIDFLPGLQDPGPFLECPLGINQEKFLFQENIFQI